MKNSLNYFTVNYYDAFGFTRTIQEFNGRHSSASIVIEVGFWEFEIDDFNLQRQLDTPLI